MACVAGVGYAVLRYACYAASRRWQVQQRDVAAHRMFTYTYRQANSEKCCSSSAKPGAPEGMRAARASARWRSHSVASGGYAARARGATRQYVGVDGSRRYGGREMRQAEIRWHVQLLRAGGGEWQSGVRRHNSRMRTRQHVGSGKAWREK